MIDENRIVSEQSFLIEIFGQDGKCLAFPVEENRKNVDIVKEKLFQLGVQCSTQTIPFKFILKSLAKLSKESDFCLISSI